MAKIKISELYCEFENVVYSDGNIKIVAYFKVQQKTPQAFYKVYKKENGYSVYKGRSSRLDDAIELAENCM